MRILLVHQGRYWAGEGEWVQDPASARVFPHVRDAIEESIGLRMGTRAEGSRPTFDQTRMEVLLTFGDPLYDIRLPLGVTPEGDTQQGDCRETG